MEIENQQLKVSNLKQAEQIMMLQDKLQGDPPSTTAVQNSWEIQLIYPEYSLRVPHSVLIDRHPRPEALDACQLLVNCFPRNNNYKDLSEWEYVDYEEKGAQHRAMEHTLCYFDSNTLCYFDSMLAYVLQSML